MSISTATLLTFAEGAAKKTALTGTATSTSSSSTTSSTSDAALSSLGQNYTEFLTLLTTQLEHQDPSSPMSTDSFTSELAQFAGVEQQVQTNSNLATLISATQENTLAEGKSLLGSTATATSSRFALQNGSAETSYTASSTAPVAIAVSDASGTIVKTETLTPAVGTNTWTWNGVSDSGSSEPNGIYSISVMQTAASGPPQSLATTTAGTITGLNQSSSGVNVNLGDYSTSLGNVTGITDASSNSS
ncbi:flagellar hook assembly protein FlgD [Acidomonas methanolica]|uniref:flagellar hook assembly protein FlgD n=1 Tax=Acidomonas methanolica TaxID=437 RepID=UPI002119E656|nr:flagellar hook capping FlgD N-terminal domain-containing protein [Acidomonas methanolica]MCQ9156268.1 flagellar biosynthesis protein FlgD [Acidomonas methanolica]